MQHGTLYAGHRAFSATQSDVETALGTNAGLLDEPDLIVDIASGKTGGGRGGQRDRLGSTPLSAGLAPARNVIRKIANRLCI